MKPTDPIIIENLLNEYNKMRDILTDLANSAACYVSDTAHLGDKYTSYNILRGDLDKAKEILK